MNATELASVKGVAATWGAVGQSLYALDGLPGVWRRVKGRMGVSDGTLTAVLNGKLAEFARDVAAEVELRAALFGQATYTISARVVPVRPPTAQEMDAQGAEPVTPQEAAAALKAMLSRHDLGASGLNGYKMSYVLLVRTLCEEALPGATTLDALATIAASNVLRLDGGVGG